MRRSVLSRIAILLGLTSTLVLLACQSGSNGDNATSSPVEALLARADSLELETEYVPPPGDSLEHHTAGFAKILCSAVFITGLDPDFAAENIGYFTSPYAERSHVTETVIDHEAGAVHLTLPSGVTRTAKYYGDQGCVALPIGEESVYFNPVAVESALPDPSTQPWPMGDVLSDEPLPAELDAEKVAVAVDAAFEPVEGMTAAFVRALEVVALPSREREEPTSRGRSLS